MNTQASRRYAVVAVVTFALGLALMAGAVWANPGDFTFQFSGTAGIPYMPILPLRAGGLAVADFNGDGLIDAAVPGMHIAGVAVIFNGAMPAAAWQTAGAGPTALAAADLDNDGDIDLAVAEDWAGGVAILANDGTGVLTQAGFYPTGRGTQAVAVTDIDRNGRLDLVVANRFEQTVSVLIAALGSFVQVQSIAVPGEPNALVVANLVGDEQPDVAVACAADDTVKVLRNIGGVFQLAGAFDAGPYPVAVAAADLDNDGDMDLAAADREAPQVTVLRNDGMGAFAAAEVPLTAGTGAFDPPVDVRLANFSNDGRIDIYCAGVWLRNLGDGVFVIDYVQSRPGVVYAKGVFPGKSYLFLGEAYLPNPGQNIVSGAWPLPVGGSGITGDINRDSHVDVTDLLYFADSWAKSVDEAGYWISCDLNRDGSVDVADLLLLAGNWGV